MTRKIAFYGKGGIGKSSCGNSPRITMDDYPKHRKNIADSFMAFLSVNSKIGSTGGSMQKLRGQPLSANPLFLLASPSRFERPAPSLGGKCSILLSYGDVLKADEIYQSC